MAVEGSPGRRRRVTGKQGGALGNIERLVIENFKSYEGRHEIGPFVKFTCIIGPNGSGKSNVMDAISFCLGIRAKHLRGDKLKDLVYRREDEDVDSNPRSATVTMEFRSGSGELLHFGRSINAKGQGSYMFGAAGKTRDAKYEEFLQRLSEEDIFVKARNFLVFQGDVMELARRQGTELTGVLETISGSDQLKEEYDRLSRELEITQERSRMHYQHRREIEGTVSLLDKQRAEVERYQQLRAQRQQCVVEAVLFKLFSAERDTERCYEAGEELRRGLNAADADHKAARKGLDEAEIAFKQAETALTETESTYQTFKSNLEQLRPEVSSGQKQIAHWSAKLEEREAEITEESRRHKALTSAVKQLHNDRAQAEAEIERLKSTDIPPVLELTESQKAEYDQAVAHVDAANSKTREKLREVEEQLRILTREMQSDRRDAKDLGDQQTLCANRMTELARERVGLAMEATTDASLLEERRKRLSETTAEIRRYVSYRDALLDEQRQLRFKLDAAKERREKLEQLEAKQRIADELRDAFPGKVIGRISELVLPTQKRFDLPLQMSFSNMAEAFVVTDAATGRECVQHLKNKQISTETFLPLDRMVEQHVGNLQVLVQGSKARRLATMCVQHNEQFLERHQQWQAEGPAYIDKTLNFLLNGTLIVDDLDEARKTAFHDAKRRGLLPRVVTLAGEVISPNRNMIVQSISPAGRVEFGGVEQLQEMKVQEGKLRSSIQDLERLDQAVERLRLQEKDTSEQARQLEEKHKALELRLQSLDATQATEQRQTESKKSRLEELGVKISKNEKRVKDLERKKDSLDEELLKAGRKQFANLNKMLGVSDVREIVQKEQRERRQLRDKIEDYEDLIRGLVHQEKSLTQQISNTSKLDTLQRDCEQYRRDIEATRQRLQDLETRMARFAKHVDETTERLKTSKDQKIQLDNEVKEKKAEVFKAKAEVDDLKKRMKMHNDKMRVLLSIRVGIFRDCEEKQVKIPLEAEVIGKTLQKVLVRSRPLEEIPLDELDAACRTTKVNFADLPEDKKEDAAQTRVFDTKGVEAEYEAKIAEITKELEKLNPNMKAVEQHQAEEGRLLEIRLQAEQAQAENMRLTKLFEAAKAERLSRFMECFKHVEACVHPFYKELTSYDGAEGGAAYLDLDDAEEPYNGGITFTACPPGKRFFPMELLSGGERSMASLALLFAMHSYKPPPFMILDEVDAPFDRKNTNSLVSYLKKLRFQCLVISLKDTFFSHSDLIVGVFKDKELQSSGTLYLPLQRLGEESVAPETERPPITDTEDVD